MAKYNRAAAKQDAHRSGLLHNATKEPTTTTYEGGTSFVSEPHAELFRLAVCGMLGNGTFYESAAAREKRFQELIREVAATQEREAWLLGFLPWLRREAGIRQAAVQGVVEVAYAWRGQPQMGNLPSPPRRIVGNTLKRGDEVGEALAYATHRFGKKYPQAFLRGLSDVLKRIGTEYTYAKWGKSASKAWTWRDALNLTHPRPVTDHQSALFKHALDEAYGNNVEIPESLKMLRAREELLAALRGSKANRAVLLASPKIVEWLREAGLTWEAVSSTGPMTASAWEALIPTMGINALLKNLRNFSEAGIADDAVSLVSGYVGDADRIRKGLVLPYQILAAWETATAAEWALPLERAADAAASNIPALNGGTLILIDTSSSMGGFTNYYGTPLHQRLRDLTKHPIFAAAFFGVATALRQERADVYGFGNTPYPFPVKQGHGFLRQVEAFIRTSGRGGHATEIALAMRQTFNPQLHRRVFVFTDGQTRDNVRSNAVSASIPVYAWDVQGYKTMPFPTTHNWFQLGGLSDQVFQMIPLFEQGQRACWPWENRESAGC